MVVPICAPYGKDPKGDEKVQETKNPCYSPKELHPLLQ